MSAQSTEDLAALVDAPIRNGLVVLDWGGDIRKFRLTIERILALQDARDSGIGEIAIRLATNRYWLQDVRETIRLGLLGGGTKEKVVERLVAEYVREGTIKDCAYLARLIVDAALYEEEPLPTSGEAEGSAVAPEV